MVSWLAKKALSATVFVCVKELKWDLEARSPEQRAVILALAELFRVSLGTSLLSEILYEPLAYSSDDILIENFEKIDDIKLKSAKTRKSLTNNAPKMGYAIPEYALRHMKDCDRGLEVLTCTLGIGIAPSCIGEVKAIWDMLLQSRQHLLAAFAHLRSTEEKANYDRGFASEMFNNLDDREWLAACNFVPRGFEELAAKSPLPALAPQPPARDTLSIILRRHLLTQNGLAAAHAFDSLTDLPEASQLAFDAAMKEAPDSDPDEIASRIRAQAAEDGTVRRAST